MLKNSSRTAGQDQSSTKRPNLVFLKNFQKQNSIFSLVSCWIFLTVFFLCFLNSIFDICKLWRILEVTQFL